MSRADFNKVHLDYGAYGFESERKGHVEFIEKNGRRAGRHGYGPAFARHLGKIRQPASAQEIVPNVFPQRLWRPEARLSTIPRT